MITVILFLLTASIAFAQGPGIASKYPNDAGIANDPAVILADDFESYAPTTDAAVLKTALQKKWSVANWVKFIHVSTAEHFAGKQAIEMTLPVSTTEQTQSLVKNLNGLNTLYFRVYMKWDAGYSVTSSNHNGINMKGGDVGNIGTTGAAPKGNDFFVFLLQNNNIKGEAAPGWLHEYVYWPKQTAQWGDHWYPTGMGFPVAASPDFVPHPQFLPQRGKWYCVEKMLRLNTVGKSDGECKIWIDGNLAADWPNLMIRTVDTLKIDETYINLHAIKSTRLNKKWYDNAVIATQYIGPMVTSASPTPSPTSSTTATPTATPTPTPVTPSPTPTSTATQTPSPTPSPTATPTPTPPTPPTPPPSPTPIATPTPSNSPSPTATATGTPTTPTATPSPSPNVAYVTVTVQWAATKDDRCTILYGEMNPPDMQADGGIAVRNGPMTVTISGLKPNTTYWFSDIVTDPTGNESLALPPKQYRTNSTPNQLFRLDSFNLPRDASPQH